MTTVDGTDIFVRLLTRMSVKDAVRWLGTPHPHLDARTPDELIASGLKHKVLALLNEGESVGTALRRAGRPFGQSAISVHQAEGARTAAGEGGCGGEQRSDMSGEP